MNTAGATPASTLQDVRGGVADVLDDGPAVLSRQLRQQPENQLC